MANSFYNDSAYEKANKKNKAVLKDYTLEMKSKKRSEKTIYQYSADIKMFFCWLVQESDNEYVLDLKKRDFRRFFLELQDGGASPARINRVQCSLRNMLEFCSEDDDEYDYPVNVMRSIKGLQKETVREIYFLTDEQVVKIMNHLLEKGKYQRALYLALSYESAGRRNEIHQVKKDDFLESSRTNTVVGKRAKKFSLLYFSKVREIAEMYFEQRGEDEIDSLWIVGRNENKQPAKSDTLYNWTLSFRKILKELTGEFIPFNSHSFRHSALECYENGSHYVLKELGKDRLPLEVLKILANHSDISTTQGYLKNKDDALLNNAFGL